MISTAIHYTDNYLFVNEYPQPDYINREMVALAWTLFTLIGIAAFLFYRERKSTAASIYLLIYSYTGLSSLGHYAFGAAHEFSWKMHGLIWLDGFAGALVALMALWMFLSRPTRAEGSTYRQKPEEPPGR